MNKAFLLLLAVLLFLPASIQAQNAEKYIKNCKPLDKEFYSKIPINYINGHLLVEVAINEKAYTFLLDTGSPSIVSTEIADELKLKTEYSDVLTDGSGIELKTDYAVVPEVKVGDIVYQNVFAAVEDFSVFRGALKCEKLSGVIGTDILKNGVCYFSTQYIILTNSIEKLNISAKGSKLSLTTRYNPIFKTTLGIGEDTVEEEMLFDSGMNDFIHWQKTTLNVVNMAFTTKPKIIAGKGNSFASWGEENTKTIEMRKAVIQTVDFAELQLTDFSCYVSDVEGSAIGARILETTDLIIDWKKKRLYTQKLERTKQRILGFSFDKDGVITELWEDSPLLLYGTELGDRITSINGQMLSAIKECDFYKMRDEFLVEEKLILSFEGREESIEI